MNHAIRRLSIACLAMFVVLMISVNYLQTFRVNSLAAEPGNPRVYNQQFKNMRGEIIASGGNQQVVIARSKPIKGGHGKFMRYYTKGRVYSPVTGYDSIYANSSPFGLTGIEQTEDKYLAGTAPGLAVSNLKGFFTGKPKQGASVYLTISPRAQLAAYQALAALGKPAAAVAINPVTGAILALASYPSFDPNALATQNGKLFQKVDQRLIHDPAQPLLNRALNDTFPPGSTFKLITSSAAFGAGKVSNPTSLVPGPQYYHLPGSHSVVTNDSGQACGDGHPTMTFALTLSCNTVFAGLGDKVGGTALWTSANLFGFNNSHLTVPLPVSPSAYPHLTDPAQVALSAIGQFNDTVTPIQEAMIAAAIANGGKLMQPYLVQAIKAPDQSVVQTAQPTELGQAVTPQVATYLTTMMESVTHDPNGTAYATAGPQATGGIDIAGKTGTAQNGVNNYNPDDAVFTCFVPNASQPIAVGVIVKGGGFGADAAAPIAVKIIQAYLQGHS